jgi:hypothetical protein
MTRDSARRAARLGNRSPEAPSSESRSSAPRTATGRRRYPCGVDDGSVLLPVEQIIWDDEEIAEHEGEDTDDGDWFAIRTDPWPCPACGQEFEYVTGAHFVIVTPAADDLIAIAQRCKEVGRNPRIVPYEDDLPTMTLFAWHAHGRPVHGIKKG